MAKDDFLRMFSLQRGVCWLLRSVWVWVWTAQPTYHKVDVFLHCVCKGSSYVVGMEIQLYEEAESSSQHSDCVKTYTQAYVWRTSISIFIVLFLKHIFHYCLEPSLI